MENEADENKKLKLEKCLWFSCPCGMESDLSDDILSKYKIN